MKASSMLLSKRAEIRTEMHVALMHELHLLLIFTSTIEQTEYKTHTENPQKHILIFKYEKLHHDNRTHLFSHIDIRNFKFEREKRKRSALNEKKKKTVVKNDRDTIAGKER